MFLLLSAVLLLIGLVGCRSRDEGAAPILDPVPAGAQASAEKAARDCLAAVQAKNYAAALRLTSPAFPAHSSPDALKADLQGPYRPLMEARQIQFDPLQMLHHGRQAVLRARFTGANGIHYRTNFTLDPAGAGWQIRSIVAPVAPRKPISASSGEATRR